MQKHKKSSNTHQGNLMESGEITQEDDNDDDDDNEQDNIPVQEYDKGADNDKDNDNENDSDHDNDNDNVSKEKNQNSSEINVMKETVIRREKGPELRYQFRTFIECDINNVQNKPDTCTLE